MEAPPGIEPGMEVLQSRSAPFRQIENSEQIRKRPIFIGRIAYRKSYLVFHNYLVLPLMVTVTVTVE